jgi:hypothetical protein
MFNKITCEKILLIMLIKISCTKIKKKRNACLIIIKNFRFNYILF